MTTPDWRRLFEGTLGVPATEGNDVEVLRNGDEIFPAMLDAIRSAERTVDLLTFIYWTGEIAQEFADALSRRAGAGVRVRVLLDQLGARSMDDQLVGQMLDAGCDVRWFRPVNGDGDVGELDHRTHRKVLICDEQVGFTGGVGIAQEWCGDARDEHEWRDTHFRVTGPAVDGLRGAFVDNWIETGTGLYDDHDRFEPQEQAGSSTVQVVTGSAESGTSSIATILTLLLLRAQSRVRIATAYFSPDDEVLELLCETARRGVRIDVLQPGPHADKRFVQLAGRATYEDLLDAGVHVHEFQPTMLHTKVATVDGQVASVGSANVNQRSTEFDEEVNLVLFDPAVVRVLDEHFDDDLVRSHEIDSDHWEGRSLLQRAKEHAVEAVDDLI